MNVENLVVMANQIAAFFEAMPDREEGLEGVSDHIRRFWAPRMRDALTAHLSAGGAGLAPFTREAILTHPILQTPTPFDADDAPPPSQRHAWDGASES